MAESPPPRMRILEHLQELRDRLRWSFLTLFILFVFFAGFQARTAVVGGVSVPYPYPDPLQPFASQFFNVTLGYLKPPYVTAIVTSPADAIMVQFKVAFFLALFSGMPMISYQLGMFVGPALKESEKRVILRIVLPSIALFGTGLLLAFFLVLPFTFNFLYLIAIGLGAQPFLHVNDFLDFVLLFMLGFGIAFQLPVIMYTLTAIGLVRAATWKKYWRFAIIGIFVFGVIITPDGSGVTMLLISVPMSGLYVAGYVAALVHERKRSKQSAA